MDGVQFTKIQDSITKVAYTDKNGINDVTTDTVLTNRDKEEVESESNCKLNHLFDDETTTLKALRWSTARNGDTLALPMSSSTGEKVALILENSTTIH